MNSIPRVQMVGVSIPTIGKPGIIIFWMKRNKASQYL